VICDSVGNVPLLDQKRRVSERDILGALRLIRGGGFAIDPLRAGDIAGCLLHSRQLAELIDRAQLAACRQLLD
jgi:hypothetical protein